jgi:hypothetical protein
MSAFGGKADIVLGVAAGDLIEVSVDGITPLNWWLETVSDSKKN